MKQKRWESFNHSISVVCLCECVCGVAPLKMSRSLRPNIVPSSESIFLISPFFMSQCVHTTDKGFLLWKRREHCNWINKLFFSTIRIPGILGIAARIFWRYIFTNLLSPGSHAEQINGCVITRPYILSKIPIIHKDGEATCLGLFLHQPVSAGTGFNVQKWNWWAGVVSGWKLKPHPRTTVRMSVLAYSISYSEKRKYVLSTVLRRNILIFKNRIIFSFFLFSFFSFLFLFFFFLSFLFWFLFLFLMVWHIMFLKFKSITSPTVSVWSKFMW